MLLDRKLLFTLNKQLFAEKEAEQKPDEQQVEKEPEGTSTVALAKALKEARENSVPKEEYDKLKKQNETLISEVINGGGDAEGAQKEATPVDIDANIKKLREELYGPKCSELNNLQFWEKTLALRENVIKKGGPDPFLPVGAKISPTDDDAVKAQNVADVVQQCIEGAEGNSEVFTALLQSRTNADSAVLTARLRKLGSMKK